MMIGARMKFLKANIELRISLIYLLFGALWIILSDRVLFFFTRDSNQLTKLQTYKGWFYVFISALLIYSLLHHYLTLQRKTNALAIENEERLRLALIAAKQGIFDSDFQTGEIRVNDTYATMLGFDPATFEETRESWLERLHPDDRESLAEINRDLADGKLQGHRAEFRFKTASGDWMWILSTGKIVEWDQQGRPLRMLGTHTDITEMKKASLEISRLLAESQRRLERIETLRAIDVAISSNYDLKQTLDVILKETITHLQVDAAAVLLYQEEEQIFKHADSLGFQTDHIQKTRTNLEGVLAAQHDNWGEVVDLDMVEPTGFDPLFVRMMREENFQQYYAISLTSKGKLIGILELYIRQPFEVDDEWRNFFKTLAGQAGVAIENAQLVNGLQIANLELLQAYDATIVGWSMAMDFRDKETEGHTQRVTEMTLALARMLGIPEDQMENIRRGALLHDIGKMGIPDAILLKPGLLTDEERAIMQKHPKMAYEMLKSIAFLRPALEIPHLHHEKWDGTGYPNGLKGEEIPLPARLFAVIDVYDALTSDRPYRPAWSKEKTLAYIQEQSGKHFDPQVVKAFLEFLREWSGLI
jgi:PAS domain S-box-containing protein/putative nucleotidyltransferase with HDIG domain